MNYDNEAVEMETRNEETNLKKKSNKRGVIKKAIFLIVILVCYFYAVTLGISFRLDSIKNMGYTKHNLTKHNINILMTYYGVYTEEYASTNEFEAKYMYYTDKAEMELEASKYTQGIVDELNELLKTEECSEGRAKAAEYGITEDNPMTVDWVLNHPIEAIEIIGADDDLIERSNIAAYYGIRNQYLQRY